MIKPIKLLSDEASTVVEEIYIQLSIILQNIYDEVANDPDIIDLIEEMKKRQEQYIKADMEKGKS